MSEGYTYTTISAGLGKPARVGVSFYLDDDAWICVAGADKGRPHLTVAHGDVSVSIGPVSGRVTPEDARLARRLADHAATWAAEVERLSKAAPPDGGAADEAAGSPAA